jgi:hypothetical protein
MNLHYRENFKSRKEDKYNHTAYLKDKIKGAWVSLLHHTV